LLDGNDALPNGVEVRRHDGSVERFPSGKVNPLRLDIGDSYVTKVGGGGGFWSPLERDPRLVLADVRSGYVSVEAAQREYGVVIHQTGRRFILDAEATRDIRGHA
jgi:N-methylhydantoinase B